MFDIDAFQERLDEETFRVGGVEYQRARLGHALRMKLADIERRVQEILRRAATLDAEYKRALDAEDQDKGARLEADVIKLAGDRDKLDVDYIRHQLRDAKGQMPPAKALQDYSTAALRALQDALRVGAENDEKDPTQPTATSGATPPS